MQNFNHKLRKVAKSSYWQSVFASSKMLSGVNLFENSTNFTFIQISFVNWLSFYNSLNYYMEDGSLPEWAYENDTYLDAFIYYMDKTKKKRKEAGNPLRDKGKDKIVKKGNVTLQGLKVVFKGKE